jgi:glycyl-tRNA synthetase beta chain
MPDFVLEIGCEEIPARMIDAASLDLRERVQRLLERERLAGASVAQFDSPRRLAVLAAGIPATQPDVTEQMQGPSAAIAFKDGQPTPAAHAFAKKAGIDVSRLERVATPKGEYLSAKVTKKGRSASDVLAELLPKEINSIYWPKNMYWRKPGEVFVRPVRWLVALLDKEVIPLEFDGIRAGSESRGHRILAPNAISIPVAGPAYVDTLRGAKVLGRSEREQQIRKALDAAARTIPGARWREDRGLLDTVVNLTEWPSAIFGSFDREFLELPEEVLVTVMRDHQKYFAVEDSAGKLLPHFLAVLNTDGDPHGIICHGHERVLRARFNDARFFWQTDQKHPLRERVQWLKQVTFQKDLGSYYEKTLRVQRLCSWLCEIIRQSGMTIRPGVVHKAAYLAKTDLTTELVKEFTELQGIVGGLYARVQELDTEMPDATRQLIAQAIYDQYKPESMEDSVPQTPGGAVLSIADKADSIAGMFALGLQPTGSKDPFALRRQANGIVKTIAEHNFPFGLSSLLRDARETYRGSEAEKNKFIFYGGQTVFLRREGQPPDTKLTQQVPFLYKDRPEAFEVAFQESIASFFRERLEFYLRDVRGFAYDVVNAVLVAGFDNVGDVVARAEAVSKMRLSVDFESISASFKRIKNIVRQADEAAKQVASAADVAAQQLTEAVARSGRKATSKAENMLAEQIAQIAPVVEEMRAARNYDGALLEVAKLRPVIDSFFDEVMVMVDDPGLRANRLALLQGLLKEFSTIADFSEIVTAQP